MLVTDGGQLIRVPVEGIRIAGRGTQGVIVFNTADEERVVAVDRIQRDGDGVGRGRGRGGLIVECKRSTRDAGANDFSIAFVTSHRVMPANADIRKTPGNEGGSLTVRSPTRSESEHREGRPGD